MMIEMLLNNLVRIETDTYIADKIMVYCFVVVVFVVGVF